MCFWIPAYAARNLRAYAARNLRAYAARNYIWVNDMALTNIRL